MYFNITIKYLKISLEFTYSNTKVVFLIILFSKNDREVEKEIGEGGMCCAIQRGDRKYKKYIFIQRKWWLDFGVIATGKKRDKNKSKMYLYIQNVLSVQSIRFDSYLMLFCVLFIYSFYPRLRPR